ncbi:aminopeptidase [Oceanobacillus neutriphilus]|uniref:Aminopeptidase n=1 Tax=Oceanobacillus neutriphilus TaxID=531815 RepID=A0ABQ2P309_9BACI|nr:aminopeptidase [Oceanobacillus neutriphilus]GGP16795.1 hypothetical protein GCM10011346_50220 [Oceanobacillus neutriphilus]
MQDYINVAESVLANNLFMKQDEQILIITDTELKEIANIFYQAGLKRKNETVLMEMTPRLKSGEEPPQTISEAMKAAEVVLCITKHSLTHTSARKNASSAGARIATMPGVTLDMLKNGAISADYNEVVERTKKYCELLNQGNQVEIKKGDTSLSFSIKNRTGIESTGVFQEKGEAGNLPSGEAYIAPIEDSANGTIMIDGSVAGIGVIEEPLTLEIEDGKLITASGDKGKELLELLGDGDGRKIAEFGIGTNNKARLIGNVLEDEKVFGTVHIAFGSNKSFGGETEANVHIDCVIKNPIVSIDNKEVIFN